MTSDVTERVLFAFHQIHHRAGDGLFAFERGHAWTFSKLHATRVNVGHFRRFDRLVAAAVVEHEQAFVGHDLVFVEELLCARKVSLRINRLDVDLALGRVLILGQQALHIARDRRRRGKENRDPHLAGHALEKALRLIGKRILLVARKIPALVMAEGEGVNHGGEKNHQHDLDDDVQSDLEPMNFFRRLAFFGCSYSLHLRDWKA